MFKWIITITFALLISVITIYFINVQTKPAITYFPANEETKFTETETNLKLFSEKDKDKYEISWTSNSKSEKPMYLRQDVSILFENGRLRGMRSKWEQNTDKIYINEKITQEDSGYFQSVSYHHGEIHTNNNITSIHKLSGDNLYVIDSPTTAIDSFKKPENRYEEEWKHLLDSITKQQLLFHWHQLLKHFSIKSKDYLTVPLTQLSKYNEEPLPNLSQEQTDKIMGQLWEGLYKNYVIPIINSNEEKVQSYIPIVLFSNQADHLIVLFESNGEKMKLIQRYSPIK
ncbi:hypothetical protein MST22_06845 [Virgibacillus halodenitrificans]|uniref:hypothetical protein n=1 Tax=Virgibacillus halodenitrificans TaxID=1482 RepID=UPI001FB50912|nr:hypothetical protein [Virgibacillus halodenitrificans]MCJ0930862.1 hypothetical protein [Virgibacillus halodenitrificans]